MNHSFDIDLATELGFEAAIIFAGIQFWVGVSRANGENLKDGRHWVYNSRAAWCEIFPYLGEKQVRNAIEKLLGASLIERGTYSYGSMNRTYWYTLTPEGEVFGRKGQTVSAKGPNLGSVERAKPETVQTNNSNSTTPLGSPTKEPNHGNNRGQRLEAYLATIEPQHWLTNPNGSGERCPMEFAGWCYREYEWNVARCCAVFAQFRDHWLADSTPKAVKRDWLAAWRNWCRNEVKWSRSPGNQNRAGSPAGGTAGPSGGARPSPLAAATAAACRHFDGQRTQDTGRDPLAPDWWDNADGGGTETGGSVPVDVSPSPEPVAE